MLGILISLNWVGKQEWEEGTEMVLYKKNKMTSGAAAKILHNPSTPTDSGDSTAEGIVMLMRKRQVQRAKQQKTEANGSGSFREHGQTGMESYLEMLQQG